MRRRIQIGMLMAGLLTLPASGAAWEVLGFGGTSGDVGSATAGAPGAPREGEDPSAGGQAADLGQVLATMEGQWMYLDAKVQEARSEEDDAAALRILEAAVEDFDGPYPEVPSQLAAALVALRDGSRTLEPAARRAYLQDGVQAVSQRVAGFHEGPEMAYGMAAGSLHEASTAPSGLTFSGRLNALVTGMEILKLREVPPEAILTEGLELQVVLSTTMAVDRDPGASLAMTEEYLRMIAISYGLPRQGASPSAAGVHCNAAAEASRVLAQEADLERQAMVLRSHARLVAYDFPGDFGPLTADLREALVQEAGESTQDWVAGLYGVMSGPYL